MPIDLDRVDDAVIAVKAGDWSALDYLYVCFADAVCSHVRSIVRRHHDAEDITQSVFMKLPKAIHRYEPRGVPFERWLLRVARNAALDHLRASRAVPVAEVFVTEEGRDECQTEIRELLKEALGQLPFEQREVVVLRHALGLSPPEIAKRLGRSEPSVHGLHHRGRRALVQTLANA